MSQKKSAIPDRWLDYKPVGKQIDVTPFLAFKVPLNDSFFNHVPSDQKFRPSDLIEMVPNLSLVIDLTNTLKYYNRYEFVNNGIQHQKIFCPGHGRIPPRKLIKKFFKIVDDFMKKNRDNGKDETRLIGVHCTHGINRTGFFICSYMMENMGYNSEKAISEFNSARGHDIERVNYLNALKENDVKPPIDREHYGPSGMEMDPTSNLNVPIEGFDEMNLKQELLRGIYAYGFEKPTAIQQRAILSCVKGHDVVTQAPTGTGKTTTFSIAVLQQIDSALNECQALILVPTRELAVETQNLFLALGDFMENLKCHTSIGGTNIREDMHRLEEGAQVVVGTPGRVCDIIIRKSLKIENIKVFVLDKADEMSSRGFKTQILQVCQHLPQDVQLLFFSSTMPADLLEVSKQFMRNPVQILAKEEKFNFEDIKQFYVIVEKEEGKLPQLYDLRDTTIITQTVIFCNTKSKVDWLADRMTKNDCAVSYLHGGMDKKKQEKSMKHFITGTSRLLISTDLLGIKIPQVNLVINYDFPSNRENYIHRIRYSKRVIINFVMTKDKRTLCDIEQFHDTHIDEMPETVADLL